MTGSSLREMASRLGGEVHGGRISCPGPGHSPKDRSLSVWFDREGTLRCNSFAGDDWRSCMDEVRFRLGLPAFDPKKKPEALKPAHRQHVNEEIECRSQEQKTALVRRLWADSLDPRGTLVQAYLATRGLELPGEVAGRTIRFHPACPFEGNGRVPVMLARYSPIIGDLDPEAPPSAVHRTALKADGSDHNGRRMLGATAGQCVKLTPNEDVVEGLGVAEGVETALAIMRVGFRPMWACASTSIMKTFPVLDGIETLTIFADNDANGAGLVAARECVARWRLADREVRVFMPCDRGHDWNDVVLA